MSDEGRRRLGLYDYLLNAIILLVAGGVITASWIPMVVEHGTPLVADKVVQGDMGIVPYVIIDVVVLIAATALWRRP